ncbi:MAG: nitroreductase family protein [Myxococcota bacterium]
MASSRYQPVPLRHERLAPDVQLHRSRMFLEVMQRRRSVRAFSAEPVPFALVENAVRAAASAPSGANQQPWRFVVVQDPAVKQRIRAGAEEEEREFYRSAPEEWRQALEPLGTDENKAYLTTAPYLVVVFAITHGWEQAPDGTRIKVKHYYVRESVGIAVGLLLASLTHAGLATLTHTPAPMAFLGTILGRPDNERAEFLIPVGYPAPDATVPAHALVKKPLEDVMVRV